MENNLQTVPSQLERYSELTTTTIPTDKAECTAMRVEVNAAIKEIDKLKATYKKAVNDEFEAQWKLKAGEVSEALNTKLIDVKNTISVREQEERKVREDVIKSTLKEANKELNTKYKYNEIVNNKLFSCAESRLKSHILSQIVLEEDKKIFNEVIPNEPEPVQNERMIKIMMELPYNDDTKKLLVSLRKQGYNYTPID